MAWVAERNGDASTRPVAFAYNDRARRRRSYGQPGGGAQKDPNDNDDYHYYEHDPPTCGVLGRLRVDLL